MGALYFSKFYEVTDNRNALKAIEQIELEEGFGDIMKNMGAAVKSLGTKAGLGILNKFTKMPKTTITLDFLQMLHALSAPKYGEAMNKLADAYGTPGGQKGKKGRVAIKDLRQGVIVGNNVNDQLAKGIPGVADPDTEQDLYKSKIHKPEIFAYMTTNGGKISIFNMPKSGTDPEDAYDADSRVYAIGLNAGGEKAFADFFGMPYKSWITTQQVTGKDTEYTEKQKNTPTAVEIDQNTYFKLLPKAPAEPVQTPQAAQTQGEKMAAAIQ
jgi:hypothetical protein